MTVPVVLVTGSTDGIGKATARALAASGAEVILHGRNRLKGSEVLRELKNETWNPRISLLIADFAVQDQVRHLARQVADNHMRLDVLINNAGTYEKSRVLTPDGIETTFAVNFLAPYLLTRELLPLLKESAQSRIVNVASVAHEDIRTIDWENLQGEKRYEPFGAYALSKFADITFTYILARNLSGSYVTANCLHPGIIATKMLRAGFPGIRGRPPSEGAEIPTYLALAPEVAGVNGRYFNESREPGRSSPLTSDRSVQERLWELAEELTGAG